MSTNNTSDIIAKVIMWIGWAFLCMTGIMFSVYLAGSGDAVNNFARPLGVFELGLMIVPFVIWMLWRFLLLPRLRNPWVQLVLYGIGAFFSQQIMLYGIFLVEEYQTIFYALSAITMIAYIPYWIRPKTPNKKGGEEPATRPEVGVDRAVECVILSSWPRSR